MFGCRLDVFRSILTMHILSVHLADFLNERISNTGRERKTFDIPSPLDAIRRVRAALWLPGSAAFTYFETALFRTTFFPLHAKALGLRAIVPRVNIQRTYLLSPI